MSGFPVRVSSVEAQRRSIVARIWPRTELFEGLLRICSEWRIAAGCVTAMHGSLLRTRFVYPAPCPEARMGARYVDPVEVEPLRRHHPRRRRQAKDCAPGLRLARAAFTDNPQAFAAQGEADAAHHRQHDAALKVHDETLLGVVDDESGSVGHGHHAGRIEETSSWV